MASPQESQPSSDRLAALSALADGTLDPRERPEVEATIAGSPQLRALYERERRIVAALHHARATDRAPQRLRAQVQARARNRTGGARRRASYTGALAGALAVVALLVVLVLPGGTPGSPSISQAAALALRGPSQPPPAPDPSAPATRLLQRLQGVYFPNWARALGWRAVGERRDRLAQRPAATVYYRWRGHEVAYTIVGAPALREPAGPAMHLAGYTLRTLTLRGLTVVTWRRAGHACVLSSGTVPASVLRRLAAWDAQGLRD
jgi:anti-sigma factor RsiW